MSIVGQQGGLVHYCHSEVHVNRTTIGNIVIYDADGKRILEGLALVIKCSGPDVIHITSVHWLELIIYMVPLNHRGSGNAILLHAEKRQGPQIFDKKTLITKGYIPFIYTY